MAAQPPSVTDFALVGLGIVLNVGAQVALKFSSGGHALSLADPGALVRTLLSPLALLAIVLYAASVANWVVVLSRMDLGLAYALMALSYILTFLLGMWCFHEPWSWTRLSGVLVIIAGVILLTRPVATPAAP
jgi:multidrug transporter EmrE-like cation transporter